MFALFNFILNNTLSLIKSSAVNITSCLTIVIEYALGMSVCAWSVNYGGVSWVAHYKMYSLHNMLPEVREVDWLVILQLHLETHSLTCTQVQQRISAYCAQKNNRPWSMTAVWCVSVHVHALIFLQCHLLWTFCVVACDHDLGLARFVNDEGNW